MSNICLLLTCLLFPLFIGLFDLQSKLTLSNTGHTIVEILILLAICWLIWLIDRFDRWLYLRSFLSGEQNLLEQNQITKTSEFASESSISSGSMSTNNSTDQVEIFEYEPSSGYAGHISRATIGKLTHKNGQ